jgi:hypothetical protein
MRNFSFNRMSDVELFITTGVVVQRCEDNPFLISLYEPFNAVTTQFSIFSDALADARENGVDYLAVGDVRRADLIAALGNLQKSLLLLTPEATTTRAHKEANFEVFNAFLAPVSVCNAARAGYVRVFWHDTSGGLLYLIEHRRQGDTVWQSSGHTTQSLILLSGFEHGAYFEFRVCTLGQDQLRSPWTEPVGIWVA